MSPSSLPSQSYIFVEIRALSLRYSLRSHVEQAISALAEVSGTGGEVQLSSAMGNILNLCDKYAQKQGDKFIS